MLQLVGVCTAVCGLLLGRFPARQSEADSNRLHEACMEEYEGLAKLLLQHGADADARDQDILMTNSLTMVSMRTNAP